jgi:hypothetical protein
MRFVIQEYRKRAPQIIHHILVHTKVPTTVNFYSGTYHACEVFVLCIQIRTCWYILLITFSGSRPLRGGGDFSHHFSPRLFGKSQTLFPNLDIERLLTWCGYYVQRYGEFEAGWQRVAIMLHAQSIPIKSLYIWSVFTKTESPYIPGLICAHLHL